MTCPFRLQAPKARHVFVFSMSLPCSIGFHTHSTNGWPSTSTRLCLIVIIIIIFSVANTRKLAQRLPAEQMRKEIYISLPRKQSLCPPSTYLWDLHSQHVVDSGHRVDFSELLEPCLQASHSVPPPWVNCWVSDSVS